MPNGRRGSSREVTGQQRIEGETHQEYERRVRGREREGEFLPTTIETRRRPSTEDAEMRSATQRLKILEKNLETLGTAVEKAPMQRKHETYAQYRKYYEAEYVPAREQYKGLVTQRRGEYIGEVGAAYPQLTTKELKTIEANISYIQRQPFAEQAPRMRGYMKQWERVAGARLEKDIMGIARGEIADPYSLKFMKAAEAFPSQYRDLPGPTEDIIAGMAKVGSLIVGSGEEILGTFEWLAGEPTTKTIKKPGWEVTIPKQRPPVSLITSFTVPEYRKWSPYAFMAAPIVIPLEFKAFGAGMKIAKTAIKTVYQAPFKGLYRVASPAIKAERMRHATISRYLGVGEAKLRVVSGVTKLRAGSYEAMFKGTTRIERAYFGEVIKPAPRWLMPKFYEKLMPSRMRVAFTKYQHIRGAVRPTWISKATYGAMPKRFLEFRAMPTQATLRGFEIGKKQATWAVGIKRVEKMIYGGRAALRPETLAKFKPSLFPEMIWFPAAYPTITPLAGAAAMASHVLAGWQAMAAPTPLKSPTRLRTPATFPTFKGMPKLREFGGVKVGTAPATMVRAAHETGIGTATAQLPKLSQQQQAGLVQFPSMGRMRLGFLPFAFPLYARERRGGVAPRQSFDVYVKRKRIKKGKGSYLSRGYKKANVMPLGRESALGLGMSIVDRFTNAQGFIKKRRGRLRREPSREYDPMYYQLRHKFRSPVRKGKTAPSNRFIEKTAFRIDTPGELWGIPYEAQRLRRRGLIQKRSRRRKKRS